MNFPGSTLACPTCGADPGVRCPAVDPRAPVSPHAHRPRVGREAQAAIDCSRCGALVGRQCRGVDGQRATPHKERTDAYLEVWPAFAPGSDVSSPAGPDAVSPSGPAIEDLLQVVREAWYDATGDDITAEDFDALKTAAKGSPVLAESAEGSPLPSPVVSDGSPVGSPVLDDPRDQQLLEYITSKVAANGGIATPLRQSDTKAALEWGLNAVKNRESKLEMMGLIFRGPLRRGARLYQVQGGQWPPSDTSVAAIAPRSTGLPSGQDTGLPTGLPSPAGLVNPDINVNPTPPAGPPGALPSVKSSSASVKPPDCDRCGPGSMQPSTQMARRGIPDAWHCAGQGRTCSYVWEAEVGEVFPSGLKQITDMDRLADIIRELKGLASGKVSRRRESRTPYADSVRSEMGKLPWECRPKRGS